MVGTLFSRHMAAISVKSSDAPILSLDDDVSNSGRVVREIAEAARVGVTAWMFDCMDQQIFVRSRETALRELMQVELEEYKAANSADLLARAKEQIARLIAEIERLEAFGQGHLVAHAERLPSPEREAFLRDAAAGSQSGLVSRANWA